ncbi:MAG: methyltransferase domain-containing protein [Alphaproteobacteria bacterium]|nr:methyltransferase domain-containing protein [Alphaproteobacteria bacterium]
MGNSATLTIERLGALGDGVAETGDGAVFVPFALPGETVEAVVEGDRGRLIRVVDAAASRVAPLCKHFGPVAAAEKSAGVGCGGCALQHLGQAAYRAWKSALITQALAARGIQCDLAPMISVGLGDRRRAVLTARRSGKAVDIGFHVAGTHDLIDLEVCPVLSPGIVSLLPGLRKLIGPLIDDRAEMRLSVLHAENGLDVDIAGGAQRSSPKLRGSLAEQAASLGIVRLSLDGDPLYQVVRPFIRCGAAEVVPPPAGFLQASSQAEAAIAGIAVGALGRRAKQAADLFCGVGAFTFALASKVKVVAMDSDVAAIEALEDGNRRTQGVRGIETRRRDLFQEPLSRKELEPFDLVVFDPPRAGARAQAEMLAKSKVPTVVAVSCNPATLARDLGILVDGGYRLEAVTPVDQFLYTAHVEAVAVLRR